LGARKGGPTAEGRRRARERLEAQGLGASRNKKMKELSKGMAQKVQLIASIVHRPEFVILDEPFSGLDPVNQQGLEAMIRGLATDGATVLFSTHVMQHAERLCDKVVLLARGQKAFEGTVAEARATSRRFLELEGEIDPDAVARLPGVAGVEVTSDFGGLRVLRAALASGGQGPDALKAAFLGGRDVRDVARAGVVVVGADRVDPAGAAQEQVVPHPGAADGRARVDGERVARLHRRVVEDHVAARLALQLERLVDRVVLDVAHEIRWAAQVGPPYRAVHPPKWSALSCHGCS